MPALLLEQAALLSEEEAATVVPAKDATRAGAVLEQEGGGDEHRMMGVVGRSRMRAREPDDTSTDCGRGGLRGGPGLAAAELKRPDPEIMAFKAGTPN